MAEPETKTTPTEFFESIGQRVESQDEDHKFVEEIESLCMNCQQNVSSPLSLAALPHAFV